MILIAPRSDSEQRRREFIRDYAKKAKPGNFAWRKVERLQGEDGDFSVLDHGTEYSPRHYEPVALAEGEVF